jgi:hypothetical protein
MSGLSERAQQLIKQARIVSFSAWQERYSPEAIALFQAADDAGRYLSDSDLADLAQLTSQASPQTTQAYAHAMLLRDRVAEIVDEARAEVLTQFPGITAPGGDLYPALRAEACWRDFWHFLRCISYGIAGQQVTYTNPPGLQAMQELYQELQVPLQAMVLGLEGLKRASLKRLPETERDSLQPYFDHLIEQMKQF